MASNRIAIIHSGSMEDITLCECIYERLSTADCKVYFQRQMPERNGHQEVLRKLRYYESNNFGLCVVISQPFFDLVWPTELKNEIVRILTNYSSKRCLHVWAPGITIDDVRKRSSVLTVNEAANFRNVSFSMLLKLNPQEITVKLKELLNEWNSDEKFTRDYEAKSAPILQYKNIATLRDARSTTQSSTAPKQYRQPEILEYPRVSALNLDDSTVASSRDGRMLRNNRQNKHHFNQRQHTSSFNKLRNATNCSRSSETLLSSMRYHDIFKLSDLFGERSESDGSTKRVGNDVRTLASLFGLSKDDVAQLDLAHLRGQRPMEVLIRILNMRKPDLTIGELEKKFETIKRLDAVNYIRGSVYRS